MEKVYVAGEYSADNVLDVLKNIGKGREVCCHLFMIGFAPFCPWHDASYVISNPHVKHSKHKFYKVSIEWLKCSDAILVISGKGKGGGVDKEIAIAEQLGIPIFYKIADLLRWRRTNGTN